LCGRKKKNVGREKYTTTRQPMQRLRERGKTKVGGKGSVSAANGGGFGYRQKGEGGKKVPSLRYYHPKKKGEGRKNLYPLLGERKKARSIVVEHERSQRSW